MHSKFISGNPIDDLFDNITQALSDIASDAPQFSVGPFDDVDSILDKFGINFGFASSLLSEFREYSDLFTADILSMEQERAELISLRPRSFAKYPALLQLGSKKASIAYCSELKDLLWDKLVAKFPGSMYDGVRIPGLALGQTFLQKYAERGVFPVEDYLPHIAIAFGESRSFQDNSALAFTLDELLTPGYGVDVTLKILDVLKATPSLSGNFSRFSGVSDFTNITMDPITYEMFLVENYLFDIQVAYDVAPSVEFAAPNFGLADLKELLSPRFPTVRAFADMVKSKIVKEIGEVLNGRFSTPVDLPGFDSFKLGGNDSDTLDLSWPSGSTRAFTPKISIDNIQGVSFHLDVGESESGSLSLDVRLEFDFVDVDPAQTLLDISMGIGNKLNSLSSDFEGLTTSLQSNFDDAADLLSAIANSDRIELLLDAKIVLAVSLSLPSFDVSATLEAFDTSLIASIGKHIVLCDDELSTT